MGRKPLLVAADLQRPGAVEQLQTLGDQIGVPVYTEATDPVRTCKNGVADAKRMLCDTVILDTAGRLQIDDELMNELKQIDKQIKPDAVYLVVDAMIGQEAANVAKTFHEALELNACILTKLDGDARGGAALSIKGVTGVPIKFVGVGEKITKLEEFNPERMAGRILGQGDMMGIVEKINQMQSQIGEEELKKQQAALEKGTFTLEQFRQQFAMIAQNGGMRDMIEKMPGGLANMIPKDVDPEESVKQVQGMIDSMNKNERRNPDVVDQSRRRRIAAGAGIEPSEVKQFLTQFDQMRGIHEADGEYDDLAKDEDGHRYGPSRGIHAGGHAKYQNQGRHGEAKNREGPGEGAEEEEAVEFVMGSEVCRCSIIFVRRWLLTNRGKVSMQRGRQA